MKKYFFVVIIVFLSVQVSLSQNNLIYASNYNSVGKDTEREKNLRGIFLFSSIGLIEVVSFGIGYQISEDISLAVKGAGTWSGSNKKSNSSFESVISDFESCDLGHWLGIRVGGQTKPKNSKIDNWNLFEWWTLFAMYEYRFDKSFSLIAEYHLFKDKNVNFERNRSAIEVGLKFRFQILNDLSLSTEGGLAFIRISPAFPIYYGGSIELNMNEKISICLNVKTYIIPDYGYWLSTGINYKIFDN